MHLDFTNITKDNPPILTLDFDGKLDAITLQYHPAAISMSERSNTQSQSGLDDVITFVAPKYTTQNTIRLSTYFTVLKPNKDTNPASGMVNTDLVTGLAVTQAVAGSQAGGREALEILDAATATISLAAGAYDIVSGTITPNLLSISPIDYKQEPHWKKLTTLSYAVDESIACNVLWDVATDIFPLNKYIITNMDIATESTHEESGTSMIIKVDLQLVKEGIRIEVI